MVGYLLDRRDIVQILSAECIQLQSHQFGILPSAHTKPARSSEPIPVQIGKQVLNSVVDLLTST